MPASFWESDEINLKLPSNMALIAEGFEQEDFEKWKRFFSYDGPYVREWNIPVKCRCVPDRMCYKHRMEKLREIYAKPRTGAEIIEEEWEK